MKKLIFTLCAFIALTFITNISFAQAPEKLWDKTIGGSSTDQLRSLIQTSDGGFLLGGYSTSNVSSEKSEDCKGGYDYWVIKLDANKNISWDKTIGGSSYEYLTSMIQTSDGGFLLGGYSISNSSFDKSEDSRGSYDYWIVKLNSNGDKLWDKTLGGIMNDVCNSIILTSDNGYLLAGRSESNISVDKSENSKGLSDFWIVKLDINGNKLWDKTIGGNEVDICTSVCQTEDGGYLLGGESYSNVSGDKSENCRGTYDYWIVKVDSNGNKIWDKTLGGSSTDRCLSAIQTSDGGYIVGGYSDSNASGEKSESSKGSNDYWVVKLDANKNISWNKTIGGDGWDFFRTMIQTANGDYLLGGVSYSNISGDKSETPHGGNDFWIVSLDQNGNKKWDKEIGGGSEDDCFSIIQTGDFSYFLGGISSSNISADKSENSRGGNDYWIVKLGSPNQPPVANNDSFEMYGNTLTVSATGVLTNDTDAESNPLTAVIETQPTKGTVVLNSDGSFTYTIGANFDGNDSFTYKANDGTDDSNVASVTIIKADPQVCSNKTLNSQEEVNSFNCSSITGNLTISGEDITDLSPLSILTSIGGYLYIHNNPLLTNLDGLSSLTSIGGDLTIDQNEALENINGLNSLTALDNVYVQYCNTLAHLDGFSKLTLIGGNLYVVSCPALQNVDGLSGITSVGGILKISSNNILENIYGLSGLTSIDSHLMINNNSSLLNLDGLAALNVIGGDLYINNGLALQQLDSFNNLTSITGMLYIRNCPLITNLNGLSALEIVGNNLSITLNSALSEFCALYTLINGSGLAGSYTISGNAANPTQQDIIDAGPCLNQASCTSVTNLNDSGAGSLREAINCANSNPGSDVITFNVAGTINVLTQLPELNDPTGGTTIDGSSAPGYSGEPIVVLKGLGTSSIDGIVITTPNNNVKGLQIHEFRYGININGNLATNNIISNNYIGNDGNTTKSNGRGVLIENAPNNIIGGSTIGDKNVISGNPGDIYIKGLEATGNKILGNLIGIDASGSLALGASNQGGITIYNSPDNIIGGLNPGEGNVISGNGSGIYMILSSASGTIIQGNLIGTDISGTSAIGNSNAIFSYQAIENSIIGGTIAGARNIISGNFRGIEIKGDNNLIQGNYFGTDITGSKKLGNGGSNITIINGKNNLVGGITIEARNIISNSSGTGVFFGGNTSTDNKVQGNYIGTDVTGTLDFGNNSGIGIGGEGNERNIIGGTQPGAGNLISGNSTGINIRLCANNIVQGNLIGTDLTGSIAIGNNAGIWIESASNNTIGGTVPEARNIISGNLHGIFIDYSNSYNTGAEGNIIQGNYIGTDISGNSELGNTEYGVYIRGGSNNVIGGTLEGARNIISGNNSVGILIDKTYSGTFANSNKVQGNYIGTNSTGSLALGNTYSGIQDGGTSSLIGGTVSGAGNVISGNNIGILVTRNGSTIKGNLIGVNSNGTEKLSNTQSGIKITSDGINCVVGGKTVEERNIISGNGGEGIEINAVGNIVQGNYIGTDITGTIAMGNSSNGIYASSGVAGEIFIGGSETGAGNVISGNNQNGIKIQFLNTKATIQGNYIGTSSTGDADLGNLQNGIYFYQGAEHIVGGETVETGNVIAFNKNNGLYAYSASSVSILGNSVLSNKNHGIYFNSGSNHIIGGNTPELGNMIAYNGKNGIYNLSTNSCTFNMNSILSNVENGIFSSGGSNHTIGGTASDSGNIISLNGKNGILVYSTISCALHQNSIFSNNEVGIDLYPIGINANDLGDGDSGPNNLQNYPELNAISADVANTTIEGILNSNPNTTFTIEFFSNSAADPSGYGEGEHFMGSSTITTDGNGDANFTEVLPMVISEGEFVTATATDPNGNTSEFSTALEYIACESPVAVCQDITIQLDVNGQADISVIDIDNGSEASCGLDNISIDQNSFDCSNMGQNIVTLMITDVRQASSTCTSIVTVDDVTAPVADVDILPTVTGECSAEVIAPSATDNCKGTITGVTTDPTSYSEQGTYTVTWTYDDGNGNISSQQQTVIVNDVTAPIADVDILPTVTGECSAEVIAPTATDNCTGTITGATTDPTSYSEQGTYTVTWTYDDGNGNTSSQQQTVIVDDVTAPVADVDILPTVTGECSAEVVAPTATDNCEGTITGATTDPTSYSEQGTYTVTWTYDDGNGNISSQEQTVIVNDVTAPVVITQNYAVQLDDNGNASITVLDIDNGSYDNCEIYTMELSQEHFTCDDIGDNQIILTVTDINGNQSNKVAIVNVSYNIPEIVVINGPEHPYPLGTLILLEIELDVPLNNDVKVIWDDGTENYYNGTTGIVYADHMYQTAGVYSVEVVILDPCNLSQISEFNYVVIYDPSAGFVTGGGWIDSPEGAYKPDLSLTGKANFGFVAKYKKGQTTPDGKTEFQFKAGNLNFNSADYEYLVIMVAGAKSLIKGTGTINGDGNYGFILSALDADLTPSAEKDKFRIKIWDKDAGDEIVYDNNISGDDNADPATTIGGGSITIHANDNKSAEIINTIELSELKVYPNPFSSVLKFEFESPNSTYARIDMYDATGRMIKTIFEQEIEGGVLYNAEFNPVDEVSGFYFYRVNMGGNIYNDKAIFKKE